MLFFCIISSELILLSTTISSYLTNSAHAQHERSERERRASQPSHDMSAIPVPRTAAHLLASAAYKARVTTTATHHHHRRRAVTVTVVNNCVAANRTAATATATAARTAANRRGGGSMVVMLNVHALTLRARRFTFTSTAAASSSASSASSSASSSSSQQEESSYLEAANRPSRFEESSWGPEEISEVLLQAMRIQWSHGYPHTPRGYPRLTHGFHEYPAAGARSNVYSTLTLTSSKSSDSSPHDSSCVVKCGAFTENVKVALRFAI